MKFCLECGSSNSDAAKFCIECGTKMIVEESESVQPPLSSQGKVNAQNLAQRLSTTFKMGALQNKRSADIMFVLDCTGSMKGEIEAIKDAITGFADTIESQGVRVRVGLVEFRDRLNGEEHRVLSFNGDIFTKDAALFRTEVAKLRAGGGGDEPESSLDGILLALRQPFTEEGNKVIVLVTDAPPHIPDKEAQSIEQVIDAIESTKVQQFYLIIRTQDSNSQIYLRLLEKTRGMAFELGKGNDFTSRAEDFKLTLMALGKTIRESTR